MRQILINLIGNAVKFTEVGQVLLLIENDPEASGPGVLRFTVADSGIGIAPEKINSIFSSFTQADSSTTRKYGGSGLGLSIAQRLAGLMDGHIRVESQLHKGSKFSFSVPFELGHAPDSPRALPNLAGYRVLIVEVSAITRLILRETIARLGGAVSEAACHEEAIAIVREADRSGEPIRMVLFASRMSGGDGFELARQIRRESSSAPLFIPTLSPDDSKSQVVVLRGEGMDAYVVKPITRHELIEAISSVIDGAASRETRPVQRSLSSETDSVAIRGVSILVAEDSPDNRLLISAYLRRTCYKLDFAENGQIALERFVSNHYDLVLMDMQMPVMDGFIATRAIREWERIHHAPHTNIVALTASALKADAVEARHAGCDAHVTKPVTKATLLDVICQNLPTPALPHD